MKHKKIVDPEVKRIKSVTVRFQWGDLSLSSSDLVLRIKQLGIEKANFQASSLALRIIKSLQVDSSWLVLQLKTKASKQAVINTVIEHYRIKDEITIGQQMIYKYLESTASKQTIVLKSEKQLVQRKSQESSIVKRFLMAESLQGMQKILEASGYLINKQMDLGEKRWKIIDSTNSKDIQFLEKWIEENEIKYGLQ